MAVVAAIFKVILIILLVILAVVAGLILLFLFFPFSYRIRGELEEKLTLKAEVHWLFYLIWFRICYTDGVVRAVLRLAGIPIQIYPAREKDQKAERKKKHRKTGQETAPELNAVQDKKTQSQEELQHQQVQPQKEPRPGETRLQREGRFTKIINSIKSFFSKIKDVQHTAERIRTELQDERNKSAFGHIIRELKYIIKHCRPSKVKADLVFGTGDPALTGQILGGISMFPFIYGKHMKLVPDFMTDDPYIKGNFEISGHIMVIHLSCAGIRLLIDKNLKRLIRRMKK